MEVLWSILGGAVGAALVTGIFSIIKWKMERKAAKEDKTEDKNDEVLKAIKTLNAKIDKVEAKVDENTALACRRDILRFGDEIDHNIKHSKEHFQQILIDIDGYNKYCEEHEDFKNSVTMHTTEKIKNTYKKCDETHSFL